MLRVIYYSSFRRVAPIVLLLVLLTLGVCIIGVNLTNGQWEERSADFVEQANSLGAALPPGGVGTINLQPCNSDELILLPAYCSREDLTERLPTRPQALLQVLLTVSGDDSAAPALVWLHDNGIISINRARFSVAVDLHPTSWKLDGPREIKVIKEAHSPNGFLSISFLQD